MSKKRNLVFNLRECGHPEICPLGRMKEGRCGRIKRLPVPPHIAERLREMGFYEDQKIRLVLKGNNVICQVCNARLGLSTKLAEDILVEPLPGGQGE